MPSPSLHFVVDSTLSLICMEVDSSYHYNTETILSLKETTAKQTGFNKKTVFASLVSNLVVKVLCLEHYESVILFHYQVSVKDTSGPGI